MAKHAGVARHAYNWGLWLTRNILTHNSNNPDSKLKFPTAIDLHKLLVAIVKPNNHCYYEVSKTAPQYALSIYHQLGRVVLVKCREYLNFRKKVK
ncbi:MAG: transposase, partial [Trichodesmium sp. St5_bin8]|nr:transposase [Trichodesmium sp. St5_bin8]